MTLNRIIEPFSRDVVAAAIQVTNSNRIALPSWKSSSRLPNPFTAHEFRLNHTNDSQVLYSKPVSFRRTVKLIEERIWFNWTRMHLRKTHSSLSTFFDFQQTRVARTTMASEEMQCLRASARNTWIFSNDANLGSKSSSSGSCSFEAGKSLQIKGLVIIKYIVGWQ